MTKIEEYNIKFEFIEHLSITFPIVDVQTDPGNRITNCLVSILGSMFSGTAIEHIEYIDFAIDDNLPDEFEVTKLWFSEQAFNELDLVNQEVILDPEANVGHDSRISFTDYKEILQEYYDFIMSRPNFRQSPIIF